MDADDIGILLITQGQQGSCLLESVTHMLGAAPPNTMAVSLVGTERRSEIEARCRAAVTMMQEKSQSVLILTDLFGSTQAAIAEKVSANNVNIACVHGVNLVMLLEAVATRYLPLRQLQRQVMQAAKQAIRRDGSAK